MNLNNYNGCWYKIAKASLTLLLMIISPGVLSKGDTPGQCSEELSAFDLRLCVEKHISDEPFVLIPYKPNYFIGSYVKDIDKENSNYENFESKFQLSFKIPISKYDKPARCLWLDGTQCISFFAYTQISVWQMLNFNQSAPFRDNNYEPELMVTQLLNKEMILGWKIKSMNYGLINHQSNGQVPPLSRSWNRSYLKVFFEKNNKYVTFKVWQRWVEEKKIDPNAFRGDDNENIEDFVGNFEIRLLKAGERINYSVAIRDSKNHINKVNVQVNWSIPLKDVPLFSADESDLRLYVQYFNGYGETLIDFDNKRERIGIGVMLTDWL